LKSFVSPVYTPNRFWIGVLFGIPAGFFEEIGWMGFAFPKMREKLLALSAAALLGLLWGLWHVPVIRYALYAAVLWLVVALVALTFGAKTLRSSPP